MAPTQRSHGWHYPEPENDVDAIDLTLSSPEPEQRPRAPPRQPQIPTSFTNGRQSNRMAHIKDGPSQAAGSVHANAHRQQARPINPHHLAQIMDTSSSADLKKVILHLCQLSPALSGAIARGLAQRSAFAQGLVNRHVHSSRNQKAGRSEESDSNDDVYERTKKRLAAKHNVNLERTGFPASTRERIPSQAVKEEHASQRNTGRDVSARESTTYVKREQPPVLTDSDNDSYIPGKFSHGTQQLNSARALPPRATSQDARGTPATANGARSSMPVSERIARIRGASGEAPKVCAQCHENFTGEDDVCIYHPGRKFKREDGVPTWSCCNGPLSDGGCKFGSHVVTEAPETKTSAFSVKPGSQTRISSQSHEPVLAETAGPYFHPGRKIKREGGLAVYSCCDGHINSSGCEVRPHVGSEEGFRRLGPSPSKKLRIL
ncbi:hypothetical protein N0V83_010233 [Neocucurbitaria cava]|uniref:Uncharacterized protein n=1 Tax=Neocucurbitaria cava TaxID=798079 RepID=A0A9W8XZ91_9PLEO|nr:hypothetical protein N0V83_010233 [Neocucurbitaria cava]